MVCESERKGKTCYMSGILKCPHLQLGTMHCHDNHQSEWALQQELSLSVSLAGQKQRAVPHKECQLTHHHFGIADALPWDKTSSSPFRCLISSFSLTRSLSHTHTVSVMLFAGSIFLRESLINVSLSKIKMLTSFSSREYVLLVRVW